MGAGREKREIPETAGCQAVGARGSAFPRTRMNPQGAFTWTRALICIPGLRWAGPLLPRSCLGEVRLATSPPSQYPQLLVH